MLSVANGLIHESGDGTPEHGARQTNGSSETSPDNGQETLKRKRPPTTRTAFPRKRAVKACHHCRTRRTKCDNIKPSCGSCLKLEARCSYDETDHSSFDPASLTIIERLSELEQVINNGFEKLQGGSTSSQLAALAAAESPNHALLHHEGLYDINNEPASRMSVEGVIAWPVFKDIQHNGNLISLLDQQQQQVSVPGSASCFDMGDEEMLLSRFIEHVLTFNPVMDEADLKQYQKNLQYTGMRWDAQTCLMLLVYAHGALAYAYELQSPTRSIDFRQTASFERSKAYFEAAQARMTSMLCSTGVMEAQCFFLAGVYLMATLQPIAAWRMFVQALTCCQILISASDNSLSQRDLDLRQSIYWTCFKSELEIRLELNISKNGTFDLSYPDFYPSPPHTLKLEKEITWYYYLAEIALRRLANRVLSTFHRTKIQVTSSVAISMVANFEDQATNWLASLPPSLRSTDSPTPGSSAIDGLLTPETNDTKSFERNLRYILKVHLLDCYEMLYFPFLAHVFEDQPISISPAIETLVAKALQVCTDRIQTDAYGFQRRHHGSWLMLRSCTRSALILVAASRMEGGGVGKLLPRGWREAVREVCGLLRFWRDESADVGERLGVLEGLMGGG